MNKDLEIVEKLLKFSDDIRYAAIYKNSELTSKEKRNSEDHSAAESDRYEELLVNPALLKLARQRGNIDCGGLRFVIVGYGNFFQLVQEINNGHISICVQKSADLNKLPQQIIAFLRETYNYYLYKM